MTSYKLSSFRDLSHKRSLLDQCAALACSGIFIGGYEYVLKSGNSTLSGIVIAHEPNQVVNVGTGPTGVDPAASAGSVTIHGRIQDYSEATGPDRIRLRSLFVNQEVEVAVQPGGFFRIVYGPIGTLGLFAFRGNELLTFQLISTEGVQNGQCRVLIKLGTKPEIAVLGMSKDQRPEIEATVQNRDTESAAGSKTGQAKSETDLDREAAFGLMERAKKKILEADLDRCKQFLFERFQIQAPEIHGALKDLRPADGTITRSRVLDVSSHAVEQQQTQLSVQRFFAETQVPSLAGDKVNLLFLDPRQWGGTVRPGWATGRLLYEAQHLLPNGFSDRAIADRLGYKGPVQDTSIFSQQMERACFGTP